MEIEQLDKLSLEKAIDELVKLPKPEREALRWYVIKRLAMEFEKAFEESDLDYSELNLPKSIAPKDH